MRLLIVSDVHGQTASLRDAVAGEPTAREVLFLGDGLRDLETVAPLFPDRVFHAVRGNCDLAARDAKEVDAVFCGGKKVVFLHGHTQFVKAGYANVIALARQNGADLLCFGHTHTPLCTYEDGLYILNPGSLGYQGTYGIADITDGGIFIDVREVRR